jgi:hypothetical protein
MESHKLIKTYFEEIAKIFDSYFNTRVNKELPFQKPEHEWLNYFYSSPIFRHIHLEYYKTDKICALHSTILPTPFIDFPIYGFDMIALGDKITGLFFDFTPTVTVHKELQECLIAFKQGVKSKQRLLPEWGTIFSDNFICLVPESDELNTLIKLVKEITYNYLNSGSLIEENYFKNIEIQNNYCQGQKKNEKTFKALTVEVGKDNAQKFFNEFLFPEIN